MALDFSNRNPDDANGIYSLDTSAAVAAWVKDDDWSQIYYSPAEARKNGANNQIRVATAITNDGRRYNVVVGADGSPISQAGDAVGSDDDVARKWQQRSQTAQRQQDQSERKRVSVTYEGSGKDRKRRTVYESGPDLVEDAPETGAAREGQRTQIEGTPNGSGGFDNERPRMVTRDAEGKEIGARELTPAEADEWRQSRERSRNPGGRTDAEITAQAEKDRQAQRQKEADDRAAADRNKPSVTIKDDGKGGVVSISTYPDGRVETKPVPGVTGKPDQVTVEGVVYERGADGTYKPAAGLPGPGANVGIEPAGAPPPNMVLGAVTADLQQYAQWLGGEVKAGRITPQQADDLLKKRRDLATTAIQEQTALGNAQRGIYGDELQQRGQNITEAANRRTSAGNSESRALQTYSPLLGKVSGEAWAGVVGAEIAAARANAARWGGMEEYPDIQLPPYLATLRGAGMATPPPGAPAAPVTAASAPAAAPQAAAAPAAPAAPLLKPPPAVPGQRPAAAPSAAPAPLSPGQAGMMSPVLDAENPPQPLDGGTAPQALFSPSAPWVDNARYGQEYSPDPIIAKLTADPWFPTDLVMETYADMYGPNSKYRKRQALGV